MSSEGRNENNGPTPNKKPSRRVSNKEQDDQSLNDSLSFEDSSSQGRSTEKKQKGSKDSQFGSKQRNKDNRNDSSNSKTPQQKPSSQNQNQIQKKAQTQKLNLTKKEKDLQNSNTQSPQNMGDEEGDEEQKKPEDDQRRKTKKMPKISLRRQMTQKRMSTFSTLSQNSLGRKSQAVGVGAGDQSPFNVNSKGSSQELNFTGRNSLQGIKSTANQQHGRQSMLVTQMKGSIGGTPGGANARHKSLGGAIEEASEDEDDESDVNTKRNETIEEFDEEEDPFKQYENDELFQKVSKIADLITNVVHSESEQNDILNYLKQLPCMEGRFDHLNKNLTKKLIDCFEVRFVEKGEYLFKKGDKPDYAYVILYGTVIYFNVKQTSYLLGQEPPSPTPEPKKEPPTNTLSTKNMNHEQLKKFLDEQKEKEMFENRKKNKIRMENCVIVEEEIKMPFEQSVGIMIGEIAMMNPENTTRALSGMAKTDCIFLLLNREAFDILVKEKEKKENEALTQFIFDCVPKMREQFQFKKVVKTVKILFPQVKYIRGKDIIKEGEKSEKIYIIKEGLCIMNKIIEVKDMLGMPKMKQEKIMNIEAGGIFGEEGLIFDSTNTYSIKAITPVILLTISYQDLKREFKRLLPGFAEFYQKRNEFIQERYYHLKQARNFERKHFNSKIEKGSMNVFLQKDFKNQIDFADKKTKRKLQVFFLRKELQQLQDAKARLNDELEKEKQELTCFHHTQSHNNSSRFISPMVETPQMQYVSKVLFPQRANKMQFHQSLVHNESMKNVKQTMNIEVKRSVILNPKLLSSSSHKSLFPNQNQQNSFVQAFQVASQLMSPSQHQATISQYQSLKGKRTLSHAAFQTIIHTNAQNQEKVNALISPNHKKEPIGSNIETDEDGGATTTTASNVRYLKTLDHPISTHSQRLQNFSNQNAVKQNRAPLRGRAASTLMNYPNNQNGQPPTISSSQIWTPSNNMSLKGSTIKSEAGQMYFFDKRIVNQQQLQNLPLTTTNKAQNVQLPFSNLGSVGQQNSSVLPQTQQSSQ